MKIVKVFLLVIIPSVLTILAFEFVLRLLGFPHNTSFIMYHKACYWRMAPTQKFDFIDEYGERAMVTINSLGSRGAQITEDKPLNTKRIICVGDSYTYGWGVDDRATYPYFLEDVIGQSQKKVQVINFGCNGHTILHEVNLIIELGKKNNFKVIYVILPWGKSKLEDLSIPEGSKITSSRNMKEFVPFLENRYGNEFQSVSLASLLNSDRYFLQDNHLNATGNKRAAEIIYDGIKDIL